MVVFACNLCGATLKKNSVDKHVYQCRTQSVSCMDCQKDFGMKEYNGHIKCITEAEKYGGGDWKAPSNFKKGEKKQQAWVDTVNATLQQAGGKLNPPSRNLLQTLSKHDNVPRKKPKFLNFINNIARNRFDSNTLENVWNLLEEQWKSQATSLSAGTAAAGGGGDEEKTKVDVKVANGVATDEAETIAPKKSKKSKRADAEETETIAPKKSKQADTEEIETIAPKKSKKSKRADAEETETIAPKKSKKSKQADAEEIETIAPKKSKKSKLTDIEEAETIVPKKSKKSKQADTEEIETIAPKKSKKSKRKELENPE